MENHFRVFLPLHSPLFMGFWIHKSTNSPVYTFSTLFYAKIMYFYMELLKAINAILLPLQLLYFFLKKQGFFGNFYEILILKIVFFSNFAIFCWKSVKFVTKTCYRNFLAKLEVHKRPILETHFGILKGFRGPCSGQYFRLSSSMA